MYMNIDDSKKIVNIFSSVGSNLDGKSSSEWLQKTLSVLNGRCGGSGDIVQGLSKTLDGLDKAESVAEEYIK